MTTENTTLLTAGVRPGSRLAAIVEGRADIMALTQATQEAVLKPREAGGITAAERIALACRMARLNGEVSLAAHYEKRMPPASRRIADLSFAGHDEGHGDSGDDPRLAAIIRHVDLVTQSPKDATRDDIATLREAGLAEADIVRLAELVAFINYQIRVAAGLRLLGEIA